MTAHILCAGRIKVKVCVSRGMLFAVDRCISRTSVFSPAYFDGNAGRGTNVHKDSSRKEAEGCTIHSLTAGLLHMFGAVFLPRDIYTASFYRQAMYPAMHILPLCSATGSKYAVRRFASVLGCLPRSSHALLCSFLLLVCSFFFLIVRCNTICYGYFV